MDNLEFEKDYKREGFSAQRKYPNEALIRFLSSNYFHLPANKRKKIRILELGCGSGANLWMIAREGFSAHGLDISPTGIELCRKMMKLWGVKADLRAGNIKRLDYKNNYFNAIVDVVSVQHTDIKGHVRTYKEVFRCLKKGGRFFQWHISSGSLSFLNGGGKRVDKLTLDKIINLNTPIQSKGPICFLSPEDAGEMLKKIGFKNINIETIKRTYNNMTEWAEYLSIQANK